MKALLISFLQWLDQKNHHIFIYKEDIAMQFLFESGIEDEVILRSDAFRFAEWLSKKDVYAYSQERDIWFDINSIEEPGLLIPEYLHYTTADLYDMFINETKP